MSEIMRPIPFPDLIRWIQGEYKNHGSVFGIRKEKFFRPSEEAAASEAAWDGIELFGTKINSPIGPAAGPNSQLAQNILAAFLAGARFVELKTVQTMDGEELRRAVARPCINAMDEGYNVEWSTELTVGGAFEEYLKAWILCHVLAKEFDLGGLPVFNMSVGYSLEGIQSKKIDDYIEGMKDARNTDAFKRCYAYISDNIGAFGRFSKDDLAEIPAAVSNSITLSTLHGCPREEIEKIASYLICEKHLHTYIKCNPTLLGYETARRLLDEMGYGYISFDDHHFKNDLQFNDAVDMLRRLQAQAKERGLGFGVKITNTFPVEINRNELPGKEMYMSGRSLFSLSLNVAKKLSDAFDGRLPISYSGGADYFNLEEILAAGIRPVTLATNILKPGGYERLSQLAELAEKVLRDMHLNAHNDPINMKALRGTPPDAHNAPVKVKALGALAASLPHRSRYRKEYRQTGSRKTTTKLPLFDCFKAPCMDGGCPINQRIPDYLAAAAEGNYPGAFKIIARDNTAPSITGTICDHQCQHKCTRVDYEDPLRIRAAKLASAENAQDDFSASLEASALKTEESAAIIGAGPAGIAAAVFLRRNGVAATVYERRNRPFGIVQHVIPAFRISDEAIYRDFRMVEKTGVEFLFDAPERYSLAELQKKHRFVVIATGAWKEGDAPVKEGAENVIDALRFLEDSKKSKCTLELGKRVAVIGGGDVAMDCARAAKRNRGVESVSLVYRRTREFMPSQFEEQEAALAEGVEILELLAPLSFIDGALDCEVMRLGAYDLSFRRSIEGTGEKKKLMFDTVIGAVGARVDTGLFAANGIALNDKGLPVVNAARESSLAGVYIAGDCKAGPATVVRAIADGKAAALDILRKLGIRADFDTAADDRAGNTVKSPDFSDLYLKKGIIAEAGPDSADAYRCLSCNTLCEICADVCPNRANVMIETGKGGLEQNFGSAQGLSQGSVQGLAPLSHQIVHIDRICNECGNCAVFCPHSGKPYRDKFTIFSGEEHFADSENSGFFRTGPDTYKIRLEDKSVLNYRRGEKNIPDTWLAMIETIETQYAYLII